jgi:hypothetical protein
MRNDSKPRGAIQEDHPQRMAQMKSRVLRTIAVLVMTITMSGMVYVENSWATSGISGGPGAGGGSGAGAGSGSSGGGDGASGSSGGGDGVAGGGGTAPAAGTGGGPGDPRNVADVESGRFFASTSPVPFPRPQSFGGLTRAQERTWDAFGQCATRGAMIDQLRVDGSFTFQSTTQSDARTTKDCMTRIGYRFAY